MSLTGQKTPDAATPLAPRPPGPTASSARAEAKDRRIAGVLVAIVLVTIGAAMAWTGVISPPTAQHAPRWIAWLITVIPENPRGIAWLFAIIPALVAIVNYWVAESPRAERTGSAVDRWLRNLRERHADDARASAVLARIDAHLQRASPTSDQPRFAYTLFGAALLTMVFGVVAQLSDGPWGLGVRETSSLGGRSAQAPTPYESPSGRPTTEISPTASPAAVATPTAPASPEPRESPTHEPRADATTAPAPPSDAALPGSVPEQKGPIVGETTRGVVYAGLGAYVLALQLLIGRINTGSLTGRFLVRLAAQSSIALILGVTAAQLGLGFAIASERQSLLLYFLLGLFPGLARQALQRRGRSVFTPDEPAYENLPLNLVDGIDDDTVDRLTEMGISDVQHLATVDPVDFMLRAGYSPMRVLDWIDQAMLITYVRRRITFARAYGIRGAIDFAVLYLDYDPKAASADLSDTAARAKVILPALATRMELPQEVLLSIGRSMWEDDNLHFVWLLWMNRVFWDGADNGDTSNDGAVGGGGDGDGGGGSGGAGGGGSDKKEGPGGAPSEEPPGLRLSGGGDRGQSAEKGSQGSTGATKVPAHATEEPGAKAETDTKAETKAEAQAAIEED